MLSASQLHTVPALHGSDGSPGGYMFQDGCTVLQIHISDSRCKQSAGPAGNTEHTGMSSAETQHRKAQPGSESSSLLPRLPRLSVCECEIEM